MTQTRYQDFLKGFLLRQTFFGHWVVLGDWGVSCCLASISDLVVEETCNRSDFTVLRIRVEVMKEPRHGIIENVLKCPYDPLETLFPVQH